MNQERKSHKKQEHNVLSDRVCFDCNRPIKQNVVDRIPHVKYCYICWKVLNGHFSSQKRKLINGKYKVVGEINFIELQAENRLIYRNNKS